MSPRYRPDIDGLRALAIVPVLLFHADLGCPGGYVGVDIFFVISGFLITSLILKEARVGNFSLVMFWERRIRRIFPALFMVVLAVLAAGCFLYLPSDLDRLGQSVVAQAALISNIYFWQHINYFNPDVVVMPLLHTWSLAVEEQFYVIFPLLLVWLARQRRFSLAGMVACLGLVSLLASVVGSHAKPMATFYLLPTRAWELMMGAFLAAIPERPRLRPVWNEAASLGGLALVLFAIFSYTKHTRFPGLAAVPPCLGTALMIYANGSKPTVLGRVLAWKPLVFTGLISYSLYLWHWPLLAFARYASLEPLSWKQRAGLLLVSVMLAAISWKWIETPFRRRVLCPRRSQVFALAGGSLLVLLTLGGGLCYTRGMAARLPAKAAEYSAGAIQPPFFNQITPQEAAAGQFAAFGELDTNQPVKILLWGDSHAMHLAPALDTLGCKYHVRGVEATHGATAPILGYVQHDTFGLNEKAPAFSQAVVDFVARQQVEIVILSAVWSAYGPPTLVSNQLVTTVQKLMASGARVYVVKDVPWPGFNVPRFATLTLLHQGDPAKLTVSPEKYTALNRTYEPVFDRLQQMGVTLLNPAPLFANAQGLYDVVRDGQALYFDDHHLSVEGSLLLVPLLEPIFQAKVP